MQSVVRHAIQITITPASRDGQYDRVYTSIINEIFTNRVNTAYNWKHVAGLELADRNPISSNPINIIMGANLFGMLVLNEKVPNMSLSCKIRYSAGFFLDQ